VARDLTSRGICGYHGTATTHRVDRHGIVIVAAAERDGEASANTLGTITRVSGCRLLVGRARSFLPSVIGATETKNHQFGNVVPPLVRRTRAPGSATGALRTGLD
jgi:hypothetical protein